MKTYRLKKCMVEAFEFKSEDAERLAEEYEWIYNDYDEGDGITRTMLYDVEIEGWFIVRDGDMVAVQRGSDGDEWLRHYTREEFDFYYETQG